MFKKMGIGVRMIAGFMIVALIAGAIGAFGLLNINVISQNDMLLYEKNTMGVAYSADAALNYQMARFNALKMTVSEGADIEECRKKIDEYIAASEDSMMKYSSLLETTEGQALYSKADSLWMDYKTYLRDVKTMVQAGQSEEALTHLLEKSADTAAALQAAFQALVDYNKEQARLKSDSNTGTANQSVILMIALLSAGVVIAVLLGLLLTRSITKPCRATAVQLSKIANGEHFEPLDISRFSGEFRKMGKNLNDVHTALYQLLGDSFMLSEAAVKGALSTRADVSKHKGGYGEIIQSINNTLDAVIAPINEAAQVLSRVAEGDLGASVTGDFAGDYAIIKHALNGTAETLKGYISEISSVLGEMSQGNLDVGITAEYRGDFIALKESLNTIVGSLNGVMGEISIAAEQVASGTRQVSDGSQEISQGATEQSSSIEELTASVTQIAAQTRQNAISAGEANTLSEEARADAAIGNEQMRAMQQAMGEINEASRSISKIIKVIDDIAFQTNILALNAAVEAARAGVHGKGFAVVAEEVRNLAARSASAAKETTELIEGSINKTTAGTKIADETASSLSKIVEGIRKAGQLVGEIASASGEQANAIAQVNRGIEQLSGVVQTNSATAEEAAAAAEELSGQSEMLKNMVGQFKLKDRASAVAAKAVKPEQPEQPALTEPGGILLEDGDFGKY